MHSRKVLYKASVWIMVDTIDQKSVISRLVGDTMQAFVIEFGSYV